MNKHLWILLFCLLGIASPIHAQPAVRESLRIGRGAVQQVEWHPDGSAILVDTILGAWLYTPDLKDITHLEGARLGTFKPDGWLLAGVDDQNRITLWETKTWQLVTAFSGHSADVTALAWSPDGTWLASADRSGLVLIWDVVGQKIVERLKLAHVNQLAWSPKGMYLAMVNYAASEITFWQKNARLFTLPPAEYVEGISAIWKDDTHLLRVNWYTGSAEGELWDVVTQKVMLHLDFGPPSDLAYSPDSALLATANINGGFVSDASTDKAISQSLTNTDGYAAVAWSPEGQYIAYGEWNTRNNQNAALTIINPITGALVQKFSGQFQAVWRVAWSPNGQQLVSVDDANQLFVWHIGQASPVASANLVEHSYVASSNNPAVSPAWSLDGQWLASADAANRIYVWDAQTGQLKATLKGQERPVREMVWQPNGHYLASRADTFMSDNIIPVWDLQFLPTSAESTTSPAIILHNSQAVTSLAWSRDGSKLAFGDVAGKILLWGSGEHDKTSVLWQGSDSVENLAWSSDNSVIAFYYHITSIFNPMVLLDVSTGKLIESGSPTVNADWTWTADNRLLWAGWSSWDNPENLIRLGIGYNSSPPDIPNLVGKPNIHLLSLSGLKNKVTKAKFSPNGTRVIAFDEGHTGMVWDIATRKALFTLTDASDAVWSPDSRRLLVYNVDAPLSILDAQTGDVLGTLNGHYAGAYESLNPFAVWSPDNRRLALLDQGVMFVYDVDND
jgi:WD40 repeat protein